MIISKAFGVAVFCGTGKLCLLSAYLKDFIAEFNILNTEGIYFKQIHYEIKIIFLRVMLPHDLLWNWLLVTQVNMVVKDVHLLEFIHLSFNYRSNDNFVDICENDLHIKEKSPLINAGIDMIL